MNRPPKYFIILQIAVALAVHSGFSQNSERALQAIRTSGNIVIDGSLNEVEWGAAIPSSDFTQFNPDEGAAPTEKTTVRILYDDNALYVSFYCYDSHPSGIVRQLTRRDRTTQSDRVSVMIDSYHDRRTAALFGGSVSGVQSDGMLSNDGIAYDAQWDAVYSFAASVTDSGWCAEFRIPFSALRFAPLDGEYLWGLNFRRYNARKNETDEWVMVRRKDSPPGTISSVSRMGHLSGIRDIHPPLHLEIMPYTSARQRYISQPQPFPIFSKTDANAGVDLKYGLTNNFTLDMAVNPDFGQVEVDKSVLNLTVFETFYPEKRPFFLEGSQIFDFGTMFDNRQLRLFYSRRIGHSPFVPQASPGYNYSDVPLSTRILGAAKLSGRTSNGFSIGALSALTSEETAAEQNLAGQTNPSVVIEPRSTYNVVRLRQDVGDNSAIGMMATNVSRDGSAPRFNGGVDMNLRPFGGRYGIDAYLAGSEFTDAAGSEHSGMAGRFGFGRLEGVHWLAYSFYDYSTPQFNVNNIGYYSQPHEHGGYTELTYKDDDGGGSILRWAVNLQTDYRWNWDGARTAHSVEVNPYLDFTNFWQLALDYYHYLPAYDDANRGISGLYRRPIGDLLTLDLRSDIRSSVSGEIFTGYRTTAKGLKEMLTTLSVTARPATWMDITPAFTIDHVRAEEAWAIPYYTSDSHNLFGDRDLDEYDFSLSGTVTFTPDMSVQFFTQVLLAKGEYANFRKLTGPDEFVPEPFTGSADFNQKNFNANIVFRWQYMPGSTFYLVWTQARYGDDGDYTHRLGRNFDETFRLPMDNVLLAKFTYWWSL